MKTIEILNELFETDPNAIHSLMCNRVPCNEKLAHHPSVEVSQPPVLPEGNYQLDCLNLINAILEANGLPLIQLRFALGLDVNGSVTESWSFVGFSEREVVVY